MLVVNDYTKAIAITPGDSVDFNVTLCGENIPEDGSPVYFTVGYGPGDRFLIEKCFPVHEGVVHVVLSTYDTVRLKPGNYKWDVRLEYTADDRYTPMEPALFKVMEAVGDTWANRTI